MTPREKTLEAVLREIIPDMVPETKGDELFLHELHKLLNQPSDWLPTLLADPPGDAVIDEGDWVMTRSGCVLGPVENGGRYKWWGPLNWLPKGQHEITVFDITHVRTVV